MKTFILLLVSMLLLVGCNCRDDGSGNCKVNDNGNVVDYMGNVCVRVMDVEGRSGSVVLEGVARGRSCRSGLIGAPGDTVYARIVQSSYGPLYCE